MVLDMFEKFLPSLTGNINQLCDKSRATFRCPVSVWRRKACAVVINAVLYAMGIYYERL